MVEEGEVCGRYGAISAVDHIDDSRLAAQKALALPVHRGILGNIKNYCRGPIGVAHPRFSEGKKRRT
jgi:hypothetical protein